MRGRAHRDPIATSRDPIAAYRPRAATAAANGAAPPTGRRHSGHVLCRPTAVGPAPLGPALPEPSSEQRHGGVSAQGLRVAQHLERRALLRDD